MNNDRNNTWQYQEDVFHDIFSGETGQNGSGGSNNFFIAAYRRDGSGIPFGGSSGIWKVSDWYRETTYFDNYMDNYSSWFLSSIVYCSMDLSGQREYKATETKPKNISLNCFMQVF